MPRKGHPEEQILLALRQVEAGKVGDVCREMGVSRQAFYGWKQKYAGLALEGAPTSARTEPKAEDAGCGLDAGQAHPAVGAVKKGLKPASRSQLVSEMLQRHGLSERRACGPIGITRWSNRYQSRRDPQSESPHPIPGLGGQSSSQGYRRLTVLLRREGWAIIKQRPDLRLVLDNTETLCDSCYRIKTAKGL